MSERPANRRSERIWLLIDTRTKIVGALNVRKWRFDGLRVSPEQVDLLSRLTVADVFDAAVLLRLDHEMRPTVTTITTMDDARRVIEDARDALRPGGSS